YDYSSHTNRGVFPRRDGKPSSIASHRIPSTSNLIPGEVNMNKPENPRIQESTTNRHQALKAMVMLLIPFLLVALVSCDTGQGGNNTPRQPYAGVPEGKPPNLGAPVPNPKEVLQTKSAGQMPDFLSQLDGAARTKAHTLYH